MIVTGRRLFSQVMTLFITLVVYLWFEQVFALRGATASAI